MVVKRNHPVFCFFLFSWDPTFRSPLQQYILQFSERRPIQPLYLAVLLLFGKRDDFQDFAILLSTLSFRETSGFEFQFWQRGRRVSRQHNIVCSLPQEKVFPWVSGGNFSLEIEEFPRKLVRKFLSTPLTPNSLIMRQKKKGNGNKKNLLCSLFIARKYAAESPKTIWCKTGKTKKTIPFLALFYLGDGASDAFDSK